MQKKIKNREALLSHGDINGRKIVLDITEKTLQHLDAYERIKSIAHMEGDTLCIGSRRWDLSKKRNVYLLGAGKACNHMAMAVDEILGDHLTRGIAIVKIKEDTDVFRKTDVYVGGHPLPNEEGLRACKEIIKLVDSANEDDLFIVVISGGSSALMSCPIEGITLQDEIDTTDVMLKSGAGIYEINAIRRHISAMNGGMLAKRIRERGAEPNAEWGSMINQSRAYMQLAPWATLAPAGATVVTVMIFNCLGDCLRDYLDVEAAK